MVGNQLIGFFLQHFTEGFDVERLPNILMPDQLDAQRVLKVFYGKDVDVLVRVALGIVLVNPQRQHFGDQSGAQARRTQENMRITVADMVGGI